MQKYIESTGKTEEAAVEAALRQLGLDRDEVSVEILARAKSGFLGIGSCPARVKVTYEAPEEPAAPAAEPEKPAGGDKPKKQPAPRGEKKPAAESPAPEKPAVEKPAEPAAQEWPAPAADDAKAARITEFLVGLLAHMGASATPTVRLGEEEVYEVELQGEQLGGLIGRRGETLDAIQQLANYAVNRGESHRVRIHVDAEGYRAKREESLRRLAERVAGKVVKYRRNMTLEPMNAYERHVIHTALQNYPDVTTYSTGTEPNRRTVVAYSRGEHRGEQ